MVVLLIAAAVVGKVRVMLKLILLQVVRGKGGMMGGGGEGDTGRGIVREV